MSDFDLSTLPDDVLSKITQEAIRLGYLPPPDGYDSNGKPCWSLDKIGAFYAHSAAESKAILERYQEKHPDRQGYVNPRDVHRIN